jgi:hypothetical protein
MTHADAMPVVTPIMARHARDIPILHHRNKRACRIDSTAQRRVGMTVRGVRANTPGVAVCRDKRLLPAVNINSTFRFSITLPGGTLI